MNEERIVVITGGVRGIGLSIAKTLLSDQKNKNSNW